MSIPLNIAEGYGKKRSAKEFQRFLVMAMGSCNELLVIWYWTLDTLSLEIMKYIRKSMIY